MVLWLKPETAEIDNLLSRGGMSGMLNTIWLVVTALSFGAILEHLGMLKKFVESILAKAKSTGSLIASTVATCIGTNLITADQYMAIVMPGRMYKEEYQKRGLHPVLLSRTLRRLRYHHLAINSLEYLWCLYVWRVSINVL